MRVYSTLRAFYYCMGHQGLMGLMVVGFRALRAEFGHSAMLGISKLYVNVCITDFIHAW